MIMETNQSYKRCIIFIDSQAAITAVAKPKRQSGQETIKQTLDNIESIKLQKPEMEIQLVWIPGHKGIEGNEKADQAAKQATDELANNRNNEPQPSTMKAARKAVIKKHINQEWKNTWLTSNENARKLRNISNRPNTVNGAKLCQTIRKRKHVTWIARLRTGHCSQCPSPPNRHCPRPHVRMRRRKGNSRTLPTEARKIR